MAAMDRCACKGALHLAEGGRVEDDDPRKPSFRKPLIGKRRKDRQDPIGATEIGPQLLRGLVAGTLGFGGDIEGLLRSGENLLRRGVGIKENDATPVLPTSDFYKDILPLKPQSPTGEAASGAGTMFAGPLSAPVLQGVRAAAPVVKSLAKSDTAYRLAQKALQGTAAAPAYAVKSPGGNWISRPFYDENAETILMTPEGAVEEALRKVRNERGLTPDVDTWAKRVIPKHIRNDLGTAADPLIKNFYEHHGHFSTGDLQAEIFPFFNDNLMMPDPTYPQFDVGQDVYGKPMQNVDINDAWYNAKKRQHLAYPQNLLGVYHTGNVEGMGKSMRPPGVHDTKISPYEKLADSTVTGVHLRDVPYKEPWMEGKDWNTQVYGVGLGSTGWPGVKDLGYDRIVRQLDDAVHRHGAIKAEKKDPFRYQGPLSLQEQELRRTGMVLDPKVLPQTSIDAASAFAGKAHEVAQQAKYRHGSQQNNLPVRAYDTPEGYHWRQLSPESLQGEGMLQDICVGSECAGHPEMVRDDYERIMSLRDKDQNIFGTVSLHRVDPHLTLQTLNPDKQADIINAYIGKDMPYEYLTEEEKMDLMVAFNKSKAQRNDPTFNQAWHPMEVKGRHNMGIPEHLQQYVREFVSQYPHNPELELEDARNMGYAHNMHGRYWMPGELEDAALRYGRVRTMTGMPPVPFDQWQSTPQDYLERFLGQGHEAAGRLHLPEDYQGYDIHDHTVRPLQDLTGYAQGGSVEDYSKPAFRTPLILRRRADRQDRAGAADAPVSVARGVLAGAMGLPGDLESLGRLGLSKLGINVDQLPTLPPSSFFNESLPFRAPESRGRGAWEGLGNMVAPGPLSATAKAAKAAAPAVRALATSEPAYRLAQRLASPGMMHAIKPPGGNWLPEVRERAGANVRGWEPEGPSEPIPEWIDKRTQEYVGKHLGTANDPFLKLEAEGKLHIDPKADTQLFGDFEAQLDYPDSRDIHKQLTGRKERTPWETFTDAQIEQRRLGDVAGRFKGKASEWAKTADPETPVYGLQDTYSPAHHLGFDKIREFIEKATDSHRARSFMNDPDFQRLLDNGDLQADPRMIRANMDIDPKKLDRMSLVDAARNLRNWQDWLDTQRDWNQGVKRVIKEYPQPEGVKVPPGKQPGSRWVELDANEQALKDEGEVMSHCVGGYCDAVREGKARILSYRTPNGPRITVEARKPHKPLEFQPGDPYYERASKELTEHPDAGSLNDRDFWDTLDAKASFHWDQDLKEGKIPWDLSQIKGQANSPPGPEYHDAVLDLLNNHGPWGNVQMEDFRRLGLVDLRKPPNEFFYPNRGLNPPKSGIYHKDKLEEALQETNPDAGISRFMIKDLLFDHNNYSEGGRVNFDDGGGVGDGDGSDGGGDAAPGVSGGEGAFGGSEGGDFGGDASGSGDTIGDIGSGGDPVGMPPPANPFAGVPPPANPAFQANQTMGLIGQLGNIFGFEANPTVAAIGNPAIGLGLSTLGVPGIAVNGMNAAIAALNGNPGQAAGSVFGGIGGIAGMGLAGPVGAVVGSMAGSAIGNAIGNAPGVPASSVPSDTSGGAGQVGNPSASQGVPGVSTAANPVGFVRPDIPITGTPEASGILMSPYFQNRARMAKGGRVGPLSY